MRPGRITLDYIAGRRMSFTNPFRFLLSLAVVYFLMINFTGYYEDLYRLGLKNADQFFANGISIQLWHDLQHTGFLKYIGAP